MSIVVLNMILKYFTNFMFTTNLVSYSLFIPIKDRIDLHL